jgi:hypothetical protein
MALVEVSNNVFIICVTLIGWNPSSHCYINSPVFDQLLDFILHLLGLPRIPHIEKLHFNESENLVFISQQLIHNFRVYLIDTSMRYCWMVSSEVVLIAFNPPHIVMGMRDYMHCQMFPLKVSGL